MSFRASGSGAYPSTQTSHVAVVLATGERLRARGAFSESSLGELTTRMNRKVLASWKIAEKGYPEVFQGRKLPRFGPEQLENFMVHPEGVTFFFDFGLPHAIEVATPASEFDWSRDEIRRFLDPKGPLGFLAEVAR